MVAIRIFIAVIMLWAVPKSYACSSFQLETYNNSFIGKSYDWKFGDGYLVFNPNRLEKQTLNLDSSKPHKWRALYPSFTYNQYGLEFPNGGINNKGLTVEVLWLDESVYAPIDPNTPVFNELQWIQYILDTQKTVRGAVRTLAEVQIKPIYAKVHYFICDIEKNCATVEYINGVPTVGNYDDTWFQVITNSTYEDSVKHLTKFKNFGGTKDVSWDSYHSLDRFVRINELLRVYNGQEPVTYAFDILDSVKRDLEERGSVTYWQIVYDVEKLISYVKTFGDKGVSGKVALRSFKSHCDGRQFANLYSESGELEFNPFTKEANEAIVRTSLKKVMPNAPESLIQAVAGAPFTYECN